MGIPFSSEKIYPPILSAPLYGVDLYVVEKTGQKEAFVNEGCLC